MLPYILKYASSAAEIYMLECKICKSKYYYGQIPIFDVEHIIPFYSRVGNVLIMAPSEYELVEDFKKEIETLCKYPEIFRPYKMFFEEHCPFCGAFVGGYEAWVKVTEGTLFYFDFATDTSAEARGYASKYPTYKFTKNFWSEIKKIAKKIHKK